MNMYETVSRMGYIKSGVLGGIFGAWAIFGLIFLVDSSLGFESGTFYKVIALALGFDITYAVYIGFLLHMIVGVTIGLLFGLLTSTRVLYTRTASKSILFGVITGIVAWLVLFIPLTFMLVTPSLSKISSIINQPMLASIADGSLLILGALSMHIVYGFILGLMHYLGIANVPRISVEH